MFKKKIIFLLFTFLILGNNAFSQDNIVYLDFNYVINNSNIGKKVIKEINDINKDNIENLKSYQNELKKEIEEINKIRNIAKAEDVKKKISVHNKKVKEYDLLQKKLSSDLNKKRNEEMNKLVKLINPILENYMKDNSIDLILNKEIIYFAKDKYDISKVILDLTNEKYK